MTRKLGIERVVEQIAETAQARVLRMVEELQDKGRPAFHRHLTPMERMQQYLAMDTQGWETFRQKYGDEALFQMQDDMDKLSKRVLERAGVSPKLNPLDLG